MKTKNKILIILASFILLLLLFNSKVFAAENQVLKNIPTDIPYYEKIFPCIDEKATNVFWLYDETASICLYTCEENSNFFINSSQSSYEYTVQLYEKGSDDQPQNYQKWYYRVAFYPESNNFINEYLEHSLVSFNKTTFPKLNVYTSHNVYLQSEPDKKYESFFQPAPQGLEAVLEEGYQTAQATTTLSITQQLEVLVPVGIVMMATIIALSLVESLPLWKQ